MAAIDIGVDCGGGRIRRVAIRARTPNPAPMLVGLRPATVSSVLGRLYAICGTAQRACAELALGAAAGQPLGAERRARLATEVAAEAVQEHLWRVWLDWPRALGLPPHEAEFTRWYGAIRADERDWPRRLAEVFGTGWLGAPDGGVPVFTQLAAFDRWLDAGGTPAARLCDALRREPAAAPCPAPSAPGTIESPLAATRAHGWIAALEDAGRVLEAQLAGRIVVIEELLRALASDPPALVDLAATSPTPGRGLGSVATARGWLEHDVTIADGLVRDYAILTPTERHFAADGPFVARLRGLPARDQAAAIRAAGLWTLAFDPCVSYVVDGAPDA